MTSGLGKVRLINPAAVAHFKREDDELVVDDLGQNAVVTDPVSPNTSVVGDQALTARTRVVQCCDLFQVHNHTALQGSIQLSELFVEFRSGLQLPRTSQRPSSAFTAERGRLLLPLASRVSIAVSAA